MTTALTPVGKVVTYPLRGDQAYATKDIQWADPSKPYSGDLYSAEAVEDLRKRIAALEAELEACATDYAYLQTITPNTASLHTWLEDRRKKVAALAAQEKA